MPRTINVDLDPLLAVYRFGLQSRGISGLKKIESTEINKPGNEDATINIKLVNTSAPANKTSRINHEDEAYLLKLLLTHKNVKIDLTAKDLDPSHNWVTFLAAADVVMTEKRNAAEKIDLAAKAATKDGDTYVAKPLPQVINSQLSGLKELQQEHKVLVVTSDIQRAARALESAQQQITLEAALEKQKPAAVPTMERPKTARKPAPMSKDMEKEYKAWKIQMESDRLKGKRDEADKRSKRPQTAGTREPIHQAPSITRSLSVPATSAKNTTAQPELKRARSDPTSDRPPSRGTVKTASHDRSFSLTNDDSATSIKIARPKTAYVKK